MSLAIDSIERGPAPEATAGDRPRTVTVAGRRVPDFFIVGAPRCGTTFLYEQLRQHPLLYLPEWKEPHFLCPDLDSGSYQDSLFFTRDLDEYLGFFKGARDDQRVGEASTWYLFSHVAATRIHELNPDARIVMTLRDPVDMVHSLHSWRVFTGNEDLERFEDALEAEADRARGLRLPPNPRNVKALAYRDVGRYAAQVERYLATFPRDRIHVIIFETLRTETMARFAETLEFLGLDASFTPDARPVHVNQAVRSRWLRDLVRGSAVARPLRRLLPRAAQNRMRRLLYAVNARDEPREPMDPALRIRLREEFRPDVARLGQLLDIDLAALWG